MKVSYSWLKEFLPLDLPAQDLAARLPLLGFEVASLETRGPAFSGVVVGSVLSKDKHPNADRLSLCVVEVGGDKYSVVCGAPNVAAGQKIALARVGAVLPGGFKITRSKIRGVESQGMICSRKELGLGDEADGIWVLDPSAEVGRDVAAGFAETDHILDLEITPNRADCLSHLGLARELSAYFRMPLKPPPAVQLPAGSLPCLDVKVEAPQACPRYVGRSFAGLSIAASPGWLVAKLESVGLRPINALVDITNYLLMDVGQPMHAFDADKLEGSIVVRFARVGEKIIALDEKEYALTERCLVIADSRKPVAIAGVMGGLHTGVTEKTKRAFLESAYFDPPTVRRTSQALRLKSDSSHRFERGADPEAAWTASLRATELILKLCGRGAGLSEPLDRRTPAAAPAPIAVTSARINAILGSSFEAGSVEAALKSISAGFAKEGETVRFTAPSYRHDLATAWDLAEEVARLAGYDKIPYRLPAAALKPSQSLPSQSLADRARLRLAALGFCEACNYDFISDKLYAQARLKAPLLRVKNPLSEDYANLRPTLLVGLLNNARINLNNGADSVRPFELGKTYVASGQGACGIGSPAGAGRTDHPTAGAVETARAAGLLLGPAAPHWTAPRGRRLGLYDAKGAVAELLAGIPGWQWRDLGGSSSAADPLFHPRASLRLSHAQGVLGTVGLLHPAAARAWDLEREEAALFELDLDLLARLDGTKARFSAYSLFPGSSRDLSFLVPASVRCGEVFAAVREAGAAGLKDVELVDRFTGPGVPAGQQSLTVRLHFGLADRTLKDSEVALAVERVLAELKN
ncbi:MAG: phenylalanine--tRNA ligase subunit beta, partial [Elusimicrobia bacterium]|nr:phenylalanine--tRNA ligase subunit beta [Elusimicrobiota bacterium]